MTKQLTDCKEVAKKIRVQIKKLILCKDCKDVDKCSKELRIALTTTTFAFSDQVKGVLKQIKDTEKADGNMGTRPKKVV